MKDTDTHTQVDVYLTNTAPRNTDIHTDAHKPLESPVHWLFVVCFPTSTRRAPPPHTHTRTLTQRHTHTHTHTIYNTHTPHTHTRTLTQRHTHTHTHTLSMTHKPNMIQETVKPSVLQ